LGEGETRIHSTPWKLMVMMTPKPLKGTKSGMP
jgi:hypothetical protein